MKHTKKVNHLNNQQKCLFVLTKKENQWLPKNERNRIKNERKKEKKKERKKEMDFE